MAKIFLWTSRLKVETHFKTKLDLTRPYIFVANHQSVLDIPAAALSVPCPFGFAAKIELSKIPFLGKAIKYSPSVFLDRSNPRDALASIKRAGESIRAGTSVIIYVEGGRSFEKELGEFKKGAFLLAIEAGVPLVPLVIQDSCMLVNERLGEARKGTAHVVVGEPISLEGVGRKDLNDLMSRVKSVIQNELDTDFPAVPVPHHNA